MTLETWIWLAFGLIFFPALWLFAWWLDRVWLDTTELMRRRGDPIREQDIPK